MHRNSTKNAVMRKENRTAPKFEEPTVRITKARAKALSTSEGLPPQRPSQKQNQKRVFRPNSKAAASDENESNSGVTAGQERKKRAVLKEVTNILCDNPYMTCIAAGKIMKQGKKGTVKKNAKVVPTIFMDPQVEEDSKAKATEDMTNARTNESQEITLTVKSDENLTIQPSTNTNLHNYGGGSLMLIEHISMPALLQIPSEEGGKLIKKLEGSSDLAVVNIDSNHRDPQMCSLYAPDIYNNLRVTELDRRPSTNYMQLLQRDITRDMRGILIDWLVEVSEEYKLVPDTLYLTVNLIDRYLSQNYIDKKRLQLLGITCMLVASKYEEICAPLVEEFCFITDNTYTRAEVLKLESELLNFFGFQLSVPTTKKFLRRFIHAAQYYKVPCVELEFLANYLAELTLTDYSFLKFLPSLIAASAVFLARWTLDQSDHPWNQTLEHYTSYNVSDLKSVVLALQDLQLNTSGSSLTAIREKYRQQKFKCVATLSSPKAVQSLFIRIED